MICLVFVNSDSLPLPCGAGSTVPRQDYFSSIIARLCDVGLPSLFVDFTFFSGGMHISKHCYIYMCTLATRGYISLHFWRLPSHLESYCRGISMERQINIYWNIYTYLQIFGPRYKSFIPIFKSFVPSFKSFIPRYKWFEDRYKWFVPRLKWFIPIFKYDYMYLGTNNLYLGTYDLYLS